MSKSNLVENVNIRINLEDMKILRKEASENRMPIATYCRQKITQHISHEV